MDSGLLQRSVFDRDSLALIQSLVCGFQRSQLTAPEMCAIISVREMSRRVSLLSVNEVRELRRVSEEEHWRVVRHCVPISILGPELDRKTARITSTVMAARLATNCRESNSDWALLSLFGKDVQSCQVGDWIGTFEEAVSTRALGVDNTLGDTFPVEMREQIDEVEILKQERPILTNALRLVRVRHGNTIGSGVESVLGRRRTICLVRDELVGYVGLEGGIW